MADNDWDRHADRHDGGPRRLINATHIDIPDADWSAVKAAAQQSQAAFDQAIADATAIPTDVKTWHAGLALRLRQDRRASALELV